jgi:hypothetical protein
MLIIVRMIVKRRIRRKIKRKRRKRLHQVLMRMMINLKLKGKDKVLELIEIKIQKEMIDYYLLLDLLILIKIYKKYSNISLGFKHFNSNSNHN